MAVKPIASYPASESVNPRDRPPVQIATGVYWLSVRGSNVYVAQSGSGWTLIDTAWAHCARPIHRAAESVFGANARPAAILLTHDHPDHAGSARDLAHQWDCPVYVHPDELALATARDVAAVEPYASPLDRRIILPLLRALGPRRSAAIVAGSNLEGVAQAFDPGDPVPGLPEWICVPTPGHSPGHVAYFRESDRVLITGDAVLTVDLNSPLEVLALSLGRNRPRLAVPPWYTNWNQRATEASIVALARLEPQVLAPGHGAPMLGASTARELKVFADRLRDRPSGRRTA
jgi:glyoxylase-like metal-dependent hydrolase (beta-lactamase superfamily II)